MDNTYLQIFLLVDVFIAGIIASIAVRHAIAHFRPHTDEVEKTVSHPKAAGVHLPTAVRDHLLEFSQAKFEAVVEKSASELQHDLSGITTQLNRRVEQLGQEIVNTEIKRYETDINRLRKQAEETLTAAQADIEKHQTEIKAKYAEQQTELETKYAKRQAELESEITTKQADLEKKLTETIKAKEDILIKNIDTRLGDAVISFLNETLQHNVDLGAQSDYLIAMLEEHKDEFKKGLSDEI